LVSHSRAGSASSASPIQASSQAWPVGSALSPMMVCTGSPNPVRVEPAETTVSTIGGRIQIISTAKASAPPQASVHSCRAIPRHRVVTSNQRS
jgi:hypothetical protein